MSAPTIIQQRYLILPNTAQSAALSCEHEWLDEEEFPEDVGIFVAILNGHIKGARPCRHCVATELIIEGRDGVGYRHPILRDAPED